MPSPQPSLQETLRHRAIEAFPGTYSGSEDAAWVIVSSQPLNATTQHALYSSAQALGTNPNDLAYVVIDHAADNPVSCTINYPRIDKQKSADKQETGKQGPTDPLLSLVEALDPLAVVLADYHSVVCASHAYNKPLALEAKEHLLGRPCICFEHLEGLMDRPEDKQRAWNCLKTLGI